MASIVLVGKHGAPIVQNRHLARWVEKLAELTAPDSIHWVDGSQAEYDMLCERPVDQGTFLRLNPALRPNCFLARSDPRDAARVEERTFICSLAKIQCRPHQ